MLPIAHLTQDKLICNLYDSAVEIGRGAFGVVYELFKGGMSTNVVLKQHLPSDDPRDRRRIIREINILVELADNPHVIDVLNYSTEHDLPWYTMPKADMNLYQYVNREDYALNEDGAISIMDDILLALEDAHSRDILHRDLAPSNILLFYNTDGTFSVRVADFGLGRDFNTGSAPLSRSIDKFLGHEAFTAPEQLLLLSDANKQSDIYSTGAILSFILTGKDPRLVKPSSGIRFLINQCMTRNPLERPNSVSELRTLLNQYRETSTQTRKTLEDLEVAFAISNSLTQQEVNDMSIHMLRSNEYTDGFLTYNNYFRQYLNLSIDIFQYWITHVDFDSLNEFVTNYCAQMKIISRQVRWTFSTMTNIGGRMMIVFNTIDDTDIKAMILSTFIDVWDRGFGELTTYIQSVLKGQYSDSMQLSTLAAVLRAKKEKVESLFQDVEVNVRHDAFRQIFE